MTPFDVASIFWLHCTDFPREYRRTVGPSSEAELTVAATLAAAVILPLVLMFELFHPDPDRSAMYRAGRRTGGRWLPSGRWLPAPTKLCPPAG